MNELRLALESRPHLKGMLITVPATAVAEALSGSGLDWLLFDLEHSVLDLRDVQSMIQAMRDPCLAMIRVEAPSGVYVKRALDTGCAGVVVPQVNSVEVARELAAAAKYAPQGARSIGLGRALGYGARLHEAVASDNARTSLIVQIEHIDAVKAADAIMAVDGVDAAFVGPYDLSASLGMPGAIEHPSVQACIDLAIRAASRAQKPIGTFAGTADAARRAFDRGFSFVAIGSELLHLQQAIANLCAALETPSPND